MADETNGRRRGIKIFTRHDPVYAEGGHKVSAPVFDQHALDALPEYYTGRGSAAALPFCDPEGTDDACLSVSWLRIGSHYPIPRHHHNLDCCYYVVAGEARLGNQTVAAGEGFFVPAFAPYGYSAGPEGAEILEFRGKVGLDTVNVESKEGWARHLETVRANKDNWQEELAPYREWSRAADGEVPFDTTADAAPAE